jgi:hypothetical protein
MSSVGKQAKAENRSFTLAGRKSNLFLSVDVGENEERNPQSYLRSLRTEHLNRDHQKQILILLWFYDALLSRPEPNRIETRRIATLQCRTSLVSMPCAGGIWRGWGMVWELFV